MKDETRIVLAIIGCLTLVLLSMVSCQWHADTLSSGCDSELKNGGSGLRNCMK